MARLIDADALMKEIAKSMIENPHSDSVHKAMHDHEHRHFLTMVAMQETAYDVDKVVEQLDDRIEITWERDYLGGRKDAFCEAIEIVRKGGVSDE